MKNKHLLFAVFIFFCSLTFVFAKDEHKDHPLVKPIENSEIQHQEISKIDEYNLALSAIEEKEIKNQKTVIGKISKTTYRASEQTSPFEIYHYLKNYFTKNGFEIVIELKKDETGNRFNRELYNLNPYRINTNYYTSIILTEGKVNCQYYLLFTGQKPSGKVYISAWITGGYEKSQFYRIDVIEVKSEEEAFTKPKDLQKGLKEKGKVVDYAVKFAPRTAELQKSSIKALGGIAELLKENPNLKLLITAHCTELDTLEANQSLSENRANEIVKALANNYNVSASRLTAKGIGQLCPLAAKTSNQNTRVEFVENWAKSAPDKQVLKPEGPQSRSRSVSRSLPSSLTSEVPSSVPDFNIKHSATIAAQQQKEGTTNEADPRPDTPVVENAVNTEPQPKPASEPLVSVPSVTGKLKLFAKNKLTKMGLKVKLIGKKVGKVSKQSPKANTKVKQGSTVTLTIGK
jgi:outer membrane protein OmpA-like peptidoglycan-associated protein